MKRRVLIVAAALFCVAWAQEDGAEPEAEKIEEEAPKEESRKEKAEKYVYCESDNCYDLLGVKKEAGGLTIKRAYRKLATEWHPDRNPDPRSKELFQKFANAYEVLSNKEMRLNYDYLLEHPMEFPMHYMRYGGASKYAPKTDAKLVLLLTLVGVAVLHHYFLKMQREDAKKRVLRNPNIQRRLAELMAGGVGGPSPKKKSGASRQEGGGAKSTPKKKDAEADDEKKKEAEAKLFAEIADELPPEPSVKDNAAWLLFTLPLYVGKGLAFNLSWFLRIRVQKAEYTDADKAYLTRRALVAEELLDAKEWDAMDDDEKASYVELELWDEDNLADYVRKQKNAVKKTGKALREARQRKKGGDGGVGMLE